MCCRPGERDRRRPYVRGWGSPYGVREPFLIVNLSVIRFASVPGSKMGKKNKKNHRVRKDMKWTFVIFVQDHILHNCFSGPRDPFLLYARERCRSFFFLFLPFLIRRRLYTKRERRGREDAGDPKRSQILIHGDGGDREGGTQEDPKKLLIFLPILSSHLPKVFPHLSS